MLKETEHSCGTDQTDIAILHLENEMKNMAEKETSMSVRRIFDKVSSATLFIFYKGRREMGHMLSLIFSSKSP